MLFKDPTSSSARKETTSNDDEVNHLKLVVKKLQ